MKTQCLSIASVVGERLRKKWSIVYNVMFVCRIWIIIVGFLGNVLREDRDLHSICLLHLFLLGFCRCWRKYRWCWAVDDL